MWTKPIESKGVFSHGYVVTYCVAITSMSTQVAIKIERRDIVKITEAMEPTTLGRLIGEYFSE